MKLWHPHKPSWRAFWVRRLLVYRIILVMGWKKGTAWVLWIRDFCSWAHIFSSSSKASLWQSILRLMRSNNAPSVEMHIDQTDVWRPASPLDWEYLRSNSGCGSSVIKGHETIEFSQRWENSGGQWHQENYLGIFRTDKGQYGGEQPAAMSVCVKRKVQLVRLSAPSSDIRSWHSRLWCEPLLEYNPVLVPYGFKTWLP